MSNQSSDLPTLVAHLQKTFQSNLITSLPPLLTRLKLLLTTSNLLTPTPSTPPHLLALSRTVFEVGAYTSIRLKDKQAFVHYLSYLQNFYSLGQGGPHEAELTGLNLLRLLAENRIAAFHTQLEILREGVRESEPVLFARGLEEWVMEGAYNRVWKAGEGKGVSVYQKFFLDVLMDTIRNEIATCLERAYPTLPISDTQILLFFPPQDHINFKNFAESRHWIINHTGNVTFPPSPTPTLSTSSSALGDDDEIPPHMIGVGGIGTLFSVGGEKILRIGLGYAGELEKVV